MHCVGSSLCVNLSEPRCYTGNCYKKYLHDQNASVKTEKIWLFFLTWLFKHSSKKPNAGVLIQHNIILQFNYLLHWERRPCYWHRACSGLLSDYCIFKNTPVWSVSQLFFLPPPTMSSLVLQPFWSNGDIQLASSCNQARGVSWLCYKVSCVLVRGRWSQVH